METHKELLARIHTVSYRVKGILSLAKDRPSHCTAAYTKLLEPLLHDLSQLKIQASWPPVPIAEHAAQLKKLERMFDIVLEDILSDDSTFKELTLEIRIEALACEASDLMKMMAVIDLAMQDLNAYVRVAAVLGVPTPLPVRRQLRDFVTGTAAILKSIKRLGGYDAFTKWAFSDAGALQLKDYYYHINTTIGHMLITTKGVVLATTASAPSDAVRTILRVAGAPLVRAAPL